MRTSMCRIQNEHLYPITLDQIFCHTESNLYPVTLNQICCHAGPDILSRWTKSMPCHAEPNILSRWMPCHAGPDILSRWTKFMSCHAEPNILSRWTKFMPCHAEPDILSCWPKYYLNFQSRIQIEKLGIASGHIFYFCFWVGRVKIQWELICLESKRKVKNTNWKNGHSLRSYLLIFVDWWYF
jgi:hypothetical protein